MPKAYSYLRFSTPEQMKGDSHRRQSTLAQKYAADHNLDLDDSLTFKDLGVSAFRGKNAEEGQLGVFLAAVHAGKVEPGSYLLVESLDRISRQAALLALGTLTSILAQGITLVTLHDGKVYSQESMTAQPMDLMYALIGFIRANDESAHKSMRIKAVWSGKRAKATQKPLTANGPAWLRLNKATGQWHVIPECAAIVRRMFQEYLSGRGSTVIASSLNREGVPVFFRETRNGPRKGAYWHRNTVRRILENPAVIGTYLPHSTEFKNRKKLRKAEGQPVPGYFPAIIDEDTFQRAQALRLGTSSPLRGKHATREETRNLFGGIAKCSRCGESMVFIDKGVRKGRRYAYLVCSHARVGAGCKYTAVPYADLEAAFLRDASMLLAMAPTSPEDSTLYTELERMDAALMGASTGLENLAEAYARTRLAPLLKEMESLKAEQDELQKQRDELAKKAGALACPLAMKRFKDLEEALKAETLDRHKVNTLLRMVAEGFTVSPDTCGAYFTWKHGNLSDWVIFGFPKDTAESNVTDTAGAPKVVKAA